MKRTSEEQIDASRLAVPVGEHDHVQGLFEAPLTLVEYGDYECPYCGSADEVVKTVQQALGKRLRFVYRNFPLTEMHPHAELAAEAAEAAGEQGSFWEMHDLLFENQEALEEEDIAEYAEELGLNVTRLLREIETGAHRERIMQDLRGGVRSGVNGTPTFFTNGVRSNAPVEAEALVAELTQTAAVS